MKTNRFGLVILLLFLTGLGWAGAQERPLTRSLDLSLTASWAYRDNFGNLGWGVAPQITYRYLLSPESSLGIVLARVSAFAQTEQPLVALGYGLVFQHDLPKAWLDLGAWTPWLGYGLLFNQAWQTGVVGRGMAHDTELCLGCDWSLSRQHHLSLALAWDQASFAAFGQAKAATLAQVSLAAGYRFLY